MNLGLPIVCWMTPRWPFGGLKKQGWGLKQPLNCTLLLGVSKLGWLKMLKNCASYFSLNRSVSLKLLNTPKSKRDWKGPRKIFRPVDEKLVSNMSQTGAPPSVGPQGGTPICRGWSRTDPIPNPAGFSFEIPGMPPVPLGSGELARPKFVTGTIGFVMKSSALK